MNSTETKLDEDADQLADRQEALDLYLNAAFDLAARGMGYQSGGVRQWNEATTGDSIQFVVVRADQVELTLLIDRVAVERMVAGTRPPTPSEESRAPYQPRWVAEKRAAPEIAEYAAKKFPVAS